MKRNHLHRLVALNLTILMLLMTPFATHASTTVSLGYNSITVDANDQATLYFTTGNDENSAYQFVVHYNASIALYDGEVELYSVNSVYFLTKNHTYRIVYTNGEEEGYIDISAIDEITLNASFSPGRHLFIPETTGFYQEASGNSYIGSIRTEDGGSISGQSPFYLRAGEKYLITSYSNETYIEKFSLDSLNAPALTEGHTEKDVNRQTTYYTFTTAESEPSVYRFCITGSSLYLFEPGSDAYIEPDQFIYPNPAGYLDYQFTLEKNTTYNVMALNRTQSPLIHITAGKVTPMNLGTAYTGTALTFTPDESGYYHISGTLDSIQSAYPYQGSNTYYLYSGNTCEISGTNVCINRALANGWNDITLDTIKNNHLFFEATEDTWYQIETNVSGAQLQVYHNGTELSGFNGYQTMTGHKVISYYQFEANKSYEISVNTAVDNQSLDSYIRITPIAQLPQDKTALTSGAYWFVPDQSGFYDFNVQTDSPTPFSPHIERGKNTSLTNVSSSFDYNDDIYYMEKDSVYFIDISYSLDDTISMSYLEPGYRFEQKEDGNVYITAYYGTDPVITLPTEALGQSITGIDDYAFRNHPFIQSVTVPEGIQSIGYAAFSDCKNLSQITFPNTLISLDGNPLGNTAYSINPENYRNDFLFVGNYLIDQNDNADYYEIPESSILLSFTGRIWNSYYIPASVEFRGVDWFTANHLFYEGEQSDWENISTEDVATIHYNATKEDISFNKITTCNRSASYYCNLCQEEFIATYNNHNPEHINSDKIIVETEPDCNNYGLSYYQCVTCGEKGNYFWTDPVHTPGELTIDKAATCGQTGIGYKECIECGETTESNITIPATGKHTAGTLIVDKAATCNSTGTGHKACAICKTTVESNISIPATGKHTAGEWVVTKEPTTESEGVKSQSCTVCGVVLATEPIAKKVIISEVFTDVEESAYYAAPVLWAVEKGITTGATETTFNPTGICSRAQIVTFLWRAAGCPEPTSTAMPFTDVPANAYYYKAVLWAVENGITSGTTVTTFSPGNNCSRAQIVTFLWRAEGEQKAETTNPFKDVADNAYYADAVLWAVENNITTGTSSITFSASNACTRGQIVTFLYRCYQ